MTTSSEKPLPALPGFAGLHHVGYSVPDLDEAIAFFTDALGFTLVSRGGPLMAGAEPDDDRMTRVFGVHWHAKVRMAFLRRDGLTVELTCWETPEQRVTPPINSDIGAAHLALAVTDLDAAVAALRLYPGVLMLEPYENDAFAYVRTPWGMLIQLMAVRST